MAQNNANQKLNDLLISKNFDPQALDSMGKPAPSPDQADLFSFDYKGESGQDYGTVVVMLTEDNNLNVYFGDNIGKSMEGDDKKGWFDFLYQLRMFAKRNLLSFSLQNLNKLKYSMQGQAAISEGLFESWSGTKTQSWNGAETEARLMIKHKRAIGENDARFRYVESLFVETAEGERYKLPFTKLSAGRAMVEHVRQGGKPYDIRGQHIATIVEEMNLLSRFRRANQGKIFEGETQQLVEQATNYYEALQNNLKSLSTKTGYNKYFEGWDPAAVSDEDVIIEDLRHMFIEQNIDSRIEQALPLLAKLQREQSMKEANIFENWANLILEGTWAVPDTKEKQAQLVSLLSQELPVGPDATNATELLYDLLGDDELFDRLEELSEQDANADAREIILTRLEQLKSNPSIAQVIGQLKNPTPDSTEPVQERIKDPRTQTEDPPNTRQPSVTPNKLDELSPDTLKSYIKKSSSDRAMRNFDQGVDAGSSMNDREPKFNADNDRRDDNRRKGIRKAVDRLEESGMSEVDLLLQDIARGNVDIYNIYASPKSNVENFVSNQIHDKVEEISRERGIPEDDDIDKILQIVQMDLEDEYGIDEGAIGKSLGFAAGELLAPEIPGSGMLGAEIGDKIGDKVHGWFHKDEEETDESVGGQTFIIHFADPDTDETDTATVSAPDMNTARKIFSREHPELYIELIRPAKTQFAQTDLEESDRDTLVHQMSQVQNQIEKIVRTGGRVGLNDPLSQKLKALKDKLHATKAVKESTALSGQYGHSGKMEEFKGNDPDTIARIKALAGIREGDHEVSSTEDNGLTAMKSISSIFLR